MAYTKDQGPYITQTMQSRRKNSVKAQLESKILNKTQPFRSNIWESSRKA